MMMRPVHMHHGPAAIGDFAFGRPLEHWFSPVDVRDPSMPSTFRWTNEAVRAVAALSGARLPAPELVDPADLKRRDELGDAEYEVLLYEFKHDLNAYLGALPDRGQPRTLAALIDWNRANAAREMPWFGQELFEQAQAKGPLTERAYRDARRRARRLAGPQGIDAALRALLAAALENF